MDNMLIELNYSIYYGSGINWQVIVEDYNDTSYTWDTKDISYGNYNIKIGVSDGVNETVWISPQKYLIGEPNNLAFIITLISIITGVGIALIAVLLVKFRILKKPSKDEPIS